jgi:hypothetical protein
MDTPKELTAQEIEIQKQQREAAKHYVAPSKYTKISADKIKLKGKKKVARKLAKRIRRKNPHQK